MHQSAPIKVRAARVQGWLSVVAYCDGKAVSDRLVVSDSRPAHVVWARAFLKAVCNAPEVLGVRQCTPYPVVYPKGGRS